MEKKFFGIKRSSILIVNLTKKTKYTRRSAPIFKHIFHFIFYFLLFFISFQRCVEIEHYCLNDEWTCVNTLCIPMEKRCDGHMNCYDHSDEYNCGGYNKI